MTNCRKSLFVAAGVVLTLISIWFIRTLPAQSAHVSDPSGHIAAEDSALILPWSAAPAASPAEAVELARVRGEFMRELIRTRPEQAIREAMSLSEWSSLSPEIQALVEQPFSTLANVEVLVSCGDDSSKTTITTEFPDLGKMETFVYGRRSGIGSKTGIPVQGIRVGQVGALRPEIFQTLENEDEAAGLKLFPVAVSDPGGDSVAALAGGKIFYFQNPAALKEANARLAALEELPGPAAGAQAFFQSLEAYILEDGAIDFQTLEDLAMAAAAEWTGTPREMYVILVDFPDRTGQPTDPVAFSNSVNTTVSQQIWEMSYEKTHIICTVNPTTYRMPSDNAAYTNSSLLFTDATNAVPGVDLDPYDTVCVFHPAIDGENYAGLATVGGRNMWLKSANPDVVIHELGHNYGARHASAWTNSVSSNPVEPAPAGGKVEYGDFTDIMGGGDAPEGHFNAWHKKKIAWFDAANWSAVTHSGSYRIYRSDHYQTTGLLRGLEIEKDATNEYWVGLRQEYPDNETFSRGAYLLWKKSGDNRSYLLDTSPLSAGGKQDGGLALGQTYSDSTAGVHITPTARGGQTPNEWMDIAVNLGSFPGNTAPTASISGPASLAVQASALFTVTASDVDGDELAYFWDVGDGLVKPNAPSIAATWLSVGTATVSCVVSDMKGGTNTVSQTVVLSSTLDNWTKRTSGTTVQLNDIAYGNGRLVAVGRDYKILYSDDGTNWTVLTKNYVYLEAVVYSGAEFVTAGIDYDFTDSQFEGAILTSADGISWTRRYLNGDDLNDVAYGGGYYVAVGENGTIVRSTDGISWNSVSSGTSVDLQSVSYGDGTFVAVGDASLGESSPHVVLTSTDGTSWTDRSAGTVLQLGIWLFDVEYCNDRFLAGGWSAEILSSTNQGVSFASTVSGSLNMEAFAYGNGTYFAAGRDIATGNADINMVSLDGVNWAELSTAGQDDRNAAVYYNGTFITVGDNGAIWQSDAIGSTALGFANWQLENAVALGLDRDPLDDADFDGHLNLMEYALGTSATEAGALPAYSSMVDPGGYFRLSHERDGIRSDVDYTVERTTNLVSNDWNSATTVVVEDSATNLTVRSAMPVATQTNEFLRLKVQLQ